MNELQIFENPEFGRVRTTVIDGEPWFVAADVCHALDIGNPSDALNRLDSDERTLVSIEGASNGKPVNGVNEPGLYSLVLGSRKPEAKAFKRWITHEVIPSIRKHGAYATPDTIDKMLASPDFGIRVLTELKKEREKSAAQAVEIEAAKPKVIFADAVATSDTCILVGALAKLLKQNGIETGQKRLFAWLRENGYLIKGGNDKNMPTQRAMEMKLFEVKEGSYVDGNGVNKTTRTTKVTGKGQQYFINKFLAEKEREQVEETEES